jgi:hypothetical protein
MAQEQQQAKTARESTEKGQIESGEWFSHNGVPMVKYSCSASELIPTIQYGNVLIGPVSVQRFAPDDENLYAVIQKTQSVCEQAVAEERQTVQTLLRSNAATA